MCNGEEGSYEDESSGTCVQLEPGGELEKLVIPTDMMAENVHMISSSRESDVKLRWNDEVLNGGGEEYPALLALHGTGISARSMADAFKVSIIRLLV